MRIDGSRLPGLVLNPSSVLCASALSRAVLESRRSFSRVGGLAALELDPPPNITQAEWSSFFHIYRPMSDPNYPTLGLLLGRRARALRLLLIASDCF